MKKKNIAVVYKMSLNKNQNFIVSQPTAPIESPQEPVQYIQNLTAKQATSFFQLGSPTVLRAHNIHYGAKDFVLIDNRIPRDTFKNAFYNPNFRVDVNNMGSKFL